MYFLVLLSALLACAAGKCYSYSNVILDGSDIQDRYMYLWTEKSRAETVWTYRIYTCNYEPKNLEQSPEKIYFLI